IPVEAEPPEAVEDDLGVLVGRARLVCVFDAQQKLAALTTREEPIEERGASAAHVQIAGGGWCKTNADGVSHETCDGSLAAPRRRGKNVSLESFSTSKPGSVLDDLAGRGDVRYPHPRAHAQKRQHRQAASPSRGAARRQDVIGSDAIVSQNLS